LEKNRKAVAQAAAEHRQAKAEREHDQCDVCRPRRRKGGSLPWRRLIHQRAGSRVSTAATSVKYECGYAGLTRTWRFRPSDALITPSAVRSAGVSTILSSDTATSLTRNPPPLIWRRASPFELTRPVLTNSASTPTPASSSLWGISTVGRFSAI